MLAHDIFQKDTSSFYKISWTLYTSDCGQATPAVIGQNTLALTMNKYGQDPDNEMQKKLSDLKAAVEQSELSITNVPFMLDGSGIKINPDSLD